MGHFPIALIGERAELTYPYHYLGAGPDSLAALAEGKGDYAEIFYRAERPIVLVGASIFTRNDGARVASLAARVAVEIGAVSDTWNGYSVLHYAASRVGALDIGFVPGEGAKTALQMASGDIDVLFSLGADEIDVERGPFVVYIGTHGDAGAHRADVILPGAAYPEKSGLYVNTEGRVQMAARASFPPGDAREDWAIVRALSDRLGARLPYDSLAQLRQALFASVPHLQRIGTVTPGDGADLRRLAQLSGAPDKTPFASVIEDFYLTNPIARASAVMAECSALAEQRTMTAAE
jgi:NADH-quinone oxidoreductase subunit G